MDHYHPQTTRKTPPPTDRHLPWAETPYSPPDRLGRHWVDTPWTDWADTTRAGNPPPGRQTSPWHADTPPPGQTRQSPLRAGNPPPDRQTPTWADTPVDIPPITATAADGTHPIGMLSCSRIVLEQIKFSQKVTSHSD